MNVKRLVCNRSQGRFVQVINQVDTSKIRTEEDEHGHKIIVVPSYTLPDNIVMNGGLYPREEIEKSYESLEGTPAPIGHPVHKDGNFASARSQIGMNHFCAGAFNCNVQRKENRIYVEKHIDVDVAMRSDLGQKLMARLNAIMEGEDVDPIHTSVGVFVIPDNKKGTLNGKDYDWVATQMEFDHDAILLDEVGAATPQEGVGMMVNKDKKFVVNRYIESGEINPEKVIEAIKNDKKGVWNTLVEFVSTHIGHGGRDAKTNQGEEMKLEDLIKSLKANGVEISDDATEAEVTEALNKQLAANKADDDKETPKVKVGAEQISSIVANAVEAATKSLNDKLDAIEAKQNADEDEERKALMDMLKNEFDEEDMKSMNMKTLKKMAEKLKGNSQQQGAFFVNGAYAPKQESDWDKLEMPNVEVK